MDDDELAALMNILTFESFKKNELIQKEGKRVEKIAIIIKGAVVGYYNDNDQDKVIDFMFENEVLADYSSFVQQTLSMGSAKAIEPSLLAVISYTDFYSFLDHYPKYENVMRQILGDTLMIQTDRFKVQRMEVARDRYLALCEMRPEVIKRVPLKYIASYLGMALETLSRIRSKK